MMRTRVTARIVLTLLLIGTLTFAFNIQQAESSDGGGALASDTYVWETWTVDSAGDVGRWTSLALDGSGYPHISYVYYDSNSDETYLKYAYKYEYGWHKQIVPYCTGFVQGYLSLALDKSGYPHISYVYYNTTYECNVMKYSYKDSSGWNTETVPYTHGSYYTSIALDKSGYPHISFNYAYEAIFYVAYTYYNGTNWKSESLDGEGSCMTVNCIALDGSGYPHISYFDGSNLKYAYKDEYSWHTETADSAGIVGQDNCIALDGISYPHISYFDQTNNDLKYAYRDEDGWHQEIADSAGNVGRWTSLALDGSGYAHISYYDSTNDDLKYAFGRPACTLAITTTTGGTTAPEPGTYTYIEGTVVSVKATPYTDYEFDHWVLDDSWKYLNPISVTMDSDHRLDAVFEYSPPPVGGVWIPVDKLALLAPYIGLASTIIVATVATAICAKRIKRRKKNQ